MKRHKLVFVLAGALGAVLLSASLGVVHASGTYEQPVAGTSSGGALATSSAYAMMHSVGQPGAVGTSASSSYGGAAGFWAAQRMVARSIFHSADVNEDEKVSATELSRVVGFYNAGAYSVNATTSDGYAPGPGLQEGKPHDSDYSPTDWKISAVELSRLVTFYNAGGYRRDPATLDGFTPNL